MAKSRHGMKQEGESGAWPCKDGVNEDVTAASHWCFLCARHCVTCFRGSHSLEKPSLLTSIIEEGMEVP